MAIRNYYLHRKLLFPLHTASHQHLLRAGRRRVGVHFRGGSKGCNTRTWISKQNSGFPKTKTRGGSKGHNARTWISKQIPKKTSGGF
jgi:hypothetical protein